MALAVLTAVGFGVYQVVGSSGSDEPTGNLDSGSGQDILQVLSELHDSGHTLLVIAHDPAVARRTRRQVTIQDGRITDFRAVES